MRLCILFLLFWITPIQAASADTPIRFGLTAVVITENLRFLDQWSQYLEHKIGRKVEFVQRRSYREVMDLLASGAIDFAWICGYPYIQAKDLDLLQLLTVPIYRGSPHYHSYIIVHESSPYKRFSDLKGRSFAFSDPDSNSGFLYPLALIAKRGETPENYFRQTFFTFNHAETVQAVAEQVADGGAVDSYIWEYIAVFRPQMTEKTRIIKKSPSFGFPPIVNRVGVDAGTVSQMRRTLEEMVDDVSGKQLLDSLKLDGFGSYADSLFNEIRALEHAVQKTNPRHSVVKTD
ncbi:MAG: phosphate/phosphite/phosphonate ABC transporter substrate-binding protein [Candidatus Thiodiazotropha sp.]|nr:phosphate/phosphite/phosphonate ABC transporter substrate-binding protein [Candidatus Thiodiazotropha sp. (ex Lucina pensylvanica)]MBV2093368.1 phosphate/phosphite/phosphonate ABC transporter substrate-binding protein [Candidatus Thiodiazotropha sp. (ex Codakia orbicularis)]PUB75226.1 MAG: phosphate/phosphite/phosphonate ABC transporter substrate-binding protein [gamma proteobacterium symbiont of Ctena orbiculata]